MAPRGRRGRCATSAAVVHRATHAAATHHCHAGVHTRTRTRHVCGGSASAACAFVMRDTAPAAARAAAKGCTAPEMVTVCTTNGVATPSRPTCARSVSMENDTQSTPASAVVSAHAGALVLVTMRGARSHAPRNTAHAVAPSVFSDAATVKRANVLPPNGALLTLYPTTLTSSESGSSASVGCAGDTRPQRATQRRAAGREVGAAIVSAAESRPQPWRAPAPQQQLLPRACQVSSQALLRLARLLLRQLSARPLHPCSTRRRRCHARCPCVILIVVRRTDEHLDALVTQVHGHGHGLHLLLEMQGGVLLR